MSRLRRSRELSRLISLQQQQRTTQRLLQGHQIGCHCTSSAICNQNQLQLLGQAQALFCDGTFQVIQDLVSQRSVTSIVFNFEAVLWSAAATVIPQASLRGCSFYWGSALRKKVQELGLAVPYRTRGVIYNYMKLLFALSYIPDEHIIPSSDLLAVVATPQVEPLSTYIHDTWLSGQHCAPWQWCAFKEATCTNNSCEGWHNQLNSRVQHGNFQIYLLIQLMNQEGD
ncbi:uncharacterized protein LOC143020537 [Oratosquilla oratoria]|uniref:uncharacterized protein LOC143020537 n=1 Tax=Oratosquilla oratoria TaxID=337810 RepID=UPI003F77364F